MRSYPVGLLLISSMGTGKKIWDSEDSARSYLYGYARPSIAFQTNGMVNTGKVQLDLAPISFLSFYLGSAKTYRSLKKMGDFNCAEIVCEGQLERHYVGAKMGLQFGTYFFMNDYRFEKDRVLKRPGPFADEQATLIGRERYDYLTQNLSVLGKRITDHWSVGILNQYSQMHYHRNTSNMLLMFGEYGWDKWKYFLASGVFKNLQHQNIFSTLLMVTWQGEKGLTLF